MGLCWPEFFSDHHTDIQFHQRSFSSNVTSPSLCPWKCWTLCKQWRRLWFWHWQSVRHHWWFFTARIRRMGEGNVLTRVCPSVCPQGEGGGGSGPAGRGGVSPAGGGGGQVQLGGVSPSRGGSGPAGGGVRSSWGGSVQPGGVRSSRGGGSASCALLRAVCLLRSRRRTFLLILCLLSTSFCWVQILLSIEGPHALPVRKLWMDKMGSFVRRNIYLQTIPNIKGRLLVTFSFFSFNVTA